MTDNTERLAEIRRDMNETGQGLFRNEALWLLDLVEELQRENRDKQWLIEQYEANL